MSEQEALVSHRWGEKVASSASGWRAGCEGNFSVTWSVDTTEPT